jgi:predicted transcriptional regulator
MSKIMIGIKVSEKFKSLLEEQAKAENRSLSNFVKNALAQYLEGKGLRYIEAEDKIEKSKRKP